MGEDADPLRRRVHVGGADREFGGLTAADARSQAAELSRAGSWGPLAKVAGVAAAWRELAVELDAAGEGSTVAALDESTRARYARRLWVEPPGGSLL